MTMLKANSKAKKVRKIAKVMCKGSSCNVQAKVMIEGVTDCKSGAQFETSGEECTYGCLGYGSCKAVCPFDAIEIVDNLAIVNPEKCKGCTLCVKECPKNIIEMVPADQEVIVECSNKDMGKDVRSKCTVGCIACQMCVRACPFWAMDFEDNLAKVNYEKCTSCTICAQKCPTKAIGADLEGKVNIVAEIDEEKCIGCTRCATVCPVTAIDGHREEAHRVRVADCVGCQLCSKECPVDAIAMVSKA